MQARLIGLQGPLANQQFPITNTGLTIGRSPDNRLVLATAQASRRHAEIRLEGTRFVLHDLGSSNGTQVNGQRIAAPHLLQPGDLIDIGGELFRFELLQPVPAVLPPSEERTIPAQPVAPAPPVQPPHPSAPGPAYVPPQMPPQTPAPSPAYVPPQMPPQMPPQTPPQAARRGLPVILLLGLLFGCVILAGIAGIAGMAISRIGPFAQQAGNSNENTNTSSNSNANDNDNNSAVTPPEGAAEWTVLVYLAADNDLERFGMIDFNEMEQVGSTDEVNILVQLDRVELRERDDDSDGDWTEARRYRINQDDSRRELNSELIEELGEVNMGDPEVLADFLTWGIESYPAQRYAVILWDHGGAWYGVAYDETSDNDAIVLPELSTALATTLQRTGVERFDLIGFDACLMAQIDVFDSIQAYGDVAVASVELEPGDGWAWDAWLQSLVDDPSQDARSIAEVIVDSYIASYEGEDDTVTLSAFDLQSFADLRERFEDLTTALNQNLNDGYSAIAEARSYAIAYSQPTPDLYSAIDLGDFADLLIRRDAPAAIADPAQSLLDAIDAARIANQNGGFYDDSSGISFFFPQTEETYSDVYPDLSPFAASTDWDEFMAQFWSAGEQVAAPPISDLSVSADVVSVNDPVTIQGTVEGPDIAYVFFFVGTTEQGGNDDVLLNDVNFYYPQNVPTNIPEWEPGANQVEVTFAGTQWAISNGAQTIPVLLGPARFGTALYGVEGVYRSAASGEEVDAALLFDVQQGQGTLTQIYGFTTGQGGEPQAFEIVPEAGDSFTALTRRYEVVNGDLQGEYVTGETITFNDQALFAFEQPLPSGEYVVGFLVRDIAGLLTYSYTELVVDNSGAGAVVNPTTGPVQGSNGNLVYSDQTLRFRIEYPGNWTTFDTGNAKVYFYDPDGDLTTFLAVDVYSLDDIPQDQRTDSLTQAFLESQQDDVQDFQQQTQIEPFTVAGIPGLTYDYSYTDSNGNTIYGSNIIVTSPNTGVSYVLIIEARVENYNNDLAIFNQMLSSLQIE